jgi:hypothetical protein
MSTRFQGLVRPPRAVSFSLRAATINGFAFKAGTLIFAAGMTLYFYLALPLTWRETRFWFAGPLLPARATVISSEPTRWAKSHGRGGFTGSNSTSRYRYRFSDANGETREGVSYADSGSPTASGKPIDIEFSPSRPWLNRIASRGRASPVEFVFNTAIAFPAVGLLLLIPAVREGRRAIRLLARGEVAAGRIVSLRANPGGPPPKPGRQPTSISVEVEFQTSNGQRVIVKRKLIERVDAIGDEAEEPVLYDPEHPKKTALLVDSLPVSPSVSPDGRWQSAGVRPLLVFALLMLTHLSYLYTAVVVLGGEP